MAGWGDDPLLAEVRTLVYEDGWTPVSVVEEANAVDTVILEKDGEQRSFSSDHIAFHALRRNPGARTGDTPVQPGRRRPARKPHAV